MREAIGTWLGRLVVVGTGVFALLMLSQVAFASADQQICGPGSGPGQCTNPGGVAFDSSLERLYVADRGNARIDVFTSAGIFVKAFGWGVADGNAELQRCVASCEGGLKGFGAGEFMAPEKIAVDPSSHDIYVFESFRVQRFNSEGEFLEAWGGGVVTGGASGTGDLTIGSNTIANVQTTKEAFFAGQTITGAGIPAATKILSLGPGTITISKAATASGTGVALSVAEGAGNDATNEVQELVLGGSVQYQLFFETPIPSQSTDETPLLKASTSSAPVIQAALEGLENIDPGDVKVTGPVKDGEGHDTYEIEFEGRYEDMNLRSIEGFSRGEGTYRVETIINGASAFETCMPANEKDCTSGVKANGDGQFGQADEPIAVGPDGFVYVGDSWENRRPDELAHKFNERVEKFEPNGVYVGELAPRQSGTAIRALAVAPSGDFYVATDAVRKYDSSGTLLESLNPSNNINALALDGAGNLFVGDSTDAQNGGETAIYEYDPSGKPLRTFYGNGTLLSRPLSLAPFSSAGGDVFASEGGASGKVVQVAFPPPGPVIHHDPKLSRAEPIGNTTATLRARINPEGKETSFHFEYVDDETFQKEGGFAKAKESSSTTLPGSADFALHDAIAEIGCADPESEVGEPESPCLEPLTTYHFRAVASNADGGPRFGPEKEFTTKAPFELIATWSSDVGTESAKLHASVNPLKIPASGVFQYVTDAQFKISGFEEANETAPVDFGAGNEPVSRAIQLTSLEPGTVYHFRVVVSDFFTSEEGPERSFGAFLPTLPSKSDCANQPFREGTAASLPDCRAYEMVSPVDKSNGDIVAVVGADTVAPARIDQATPQGEKLTYSTYRAIGDPQSAPFSSQYIAERDPAAGWHSRAINAPREGPSLYSAANGTDSSFKGFSEDLCSGWFLQDTENPLADGAPEGVPNLYRRQNCGEEGYELITTVSPPGFGKALEGHDSLYRPTPQGFSADDLTSVLRAPAPLTPDASKEDIYQTYLYRGGELHLISVLQGNTKAMAANRNSSVGTGSGQLGAANNFRRDSVNHAISADGSRVFWSAEIGEGAKAHDPNSGPMGPSSLYLRINPTEVQSKVSGGKCAEAEKACTIAISDAIAPETPATFQMADPQGTKAFFTAAGSLFEVDVAKAIAYEAGAVSLIAAKVIGLMGASEDLSRVYLVSEEDLDGGGPAEAGKANLYLREAGVGFSFVATLASGSKVPSGDRAPYATEPLKRSSRVDANGQHVVFMSTASLVGGYDNSDVSSPASCGTAGGTCNAAAEVYLYDAGGEGELRCVSCNPSGARPVGRDLGIGGDAGSFYVAARIPGWETQYHPSRVLSDDGSRLFFESFEGLVPRDTNGKQDVYEWERSESKAQCEEAGAELYAASSGGCLSLISSGTSAGDAEFLDASADGRDVFFTTASSLLPQDYGLVDIYDAREGGGFPSPLVPPKQPCEGEACQSPPAPPDAPSPSSSTFEGQGNLSTPPNKRCPKGKRKVRKAGKTRCVKKPKKAKHHKRSHGEKGAGR